MRIRLLKPGFFKNEELARLPFAARLLYAGLWTLADREGRLEDRPARLKIELFPYDAVDVGALLEALDAADFIRRYVVAGRRYLWIPTFLQHQRPHPRELASGLPAPALGEPCLGAARVMPGPGLGAARATPRTPVLDPVSDPVSDPDPVSNPDPDPVLDPVLQTGDCGKAVENGATVTPRILTIAREALELTDPDGRDEDLLIDSIQYHARTRSVTLSRAHTRAVLEVVLRERAAELRARAVR